VCSRGSIIPLILHGEGAGVRGSNYDLFIIISPSLFMELPVDVNYTLYIVR
jgi:hypothetical protein